MLDRIFSAAVVIPMLALTATAVVAFLNLSDVQMRNERQTAVTRQFIKLDQDRDGFLSIAEAIAGYRAAFDRLDFDQDGRLSRENFVGRLRPEWAKYHKTERFKRDQAALEKEMLVIDKDRDRQLSFDEYASHYLAEIFTAMDSDGDGKVSTSEYRARWLPE